jgi:hypothetical protein
MIRTKRKGDSTSDQKQCSGRDGKSCHAMGQISPSGTHCKDCCPDKLKCQVLAHSDKSKRTKMEGGGGGGRAEKPRTGSRAGAATLVCEVRSLTDHAVRTHFMITQKAKATDVSSNVGKSSGAGAAVESGGDGNTSNDDSNNSPCEKKSKSGTSKRGILIDPLLTRSSAYVVLFILCVWMRCVFSRW